MVRTICLVALRVKIKRMLVNDKAAFLGDFFGGVLFLRRKTLHRDRSRCTPDDHGVCWP